MTGVKGQHLISKGKMSMVALIVSKAKAVISIVWLTKMFGVR